MKTDRATEDAIAADLAAGSSLREAAKKHGVAASTVARIKADRMPPTEPKSDESDVAAIVEEVLRRMGRDMGAAKAEVIEPAPPSPFLADRRSMTADVSGRRWERVAFVSDLHVPFQDDIAIDAACKVIRAFRPHALVVGGDLYDCYSISDHDRDPGRCDTIQDEFDSGKPVIKKLDDAAGDAEVLFVEGNHEERIPRLQRRNPGLFRLRALELPRAAEFPRRWHFFANQTSIKAGALTMLHGDIKGRGTNSKHAAAGMLSKLRTSCLFGHLHRFQTFFETTADGTYRAGYANGHLCDPLQARYITSPDWQSGLTLIDFDWSLNIFMVRPQLIVRGATISGGTTYLGLHDV